MPKLVTQDDGTVRWDYDVKDKPKKKTAKKAAPAAESKES